jgi:hypothetical protein
MTASNSSKASTKATTEDTAAPAPAIAPAGGDTVTAAPLDGSPAATAAAATTDAAAAPVNDNRVPIMLAHPVDTIETMRRLRIEPKADGTPYAVGETIRLYRDEARALINCGYAQVDPEDPNAVRRALFPEKFVPTV